MITIFIIFFSILGSGVTYYWAVTYKQSPVLTSAASSLVAGLILYAAQAWLGESVCKSLSLAFLEGHL
jgi:hypothetical protein